MHDPKIDDPRATSDSHTTTHSSNRNAAAASLYTTSSHSSTKKQTSIVMLSSVLSRRVAPSFVAGHRCLSSAIPETMKVRSGCLPEGRKGTTMTKQNKNPRGTTTAFVCRSRFLVSRISFSMTNVGADLPSTSFLAISLSSIRRRSFVKSVTRTS